VCVQFSIYCPWHDIFISWHSGLCRHLLSVFSVSSSSVNCIYILQYSSWGTVLAMGLFYPKLCCLYAVKKTGTNKIQIYGLKRSVTSLENKSKLLPAQEHYILSQKSWIFKRKLIYWSRNSIVVTTTMLQDACPWSRASVHSKNFLSSPNLRDRLRYPPSLLLNLHQVLFP
jgi:hypothetical protein